MHRAVPIGVPSNALSKIVINTSRVPKPQIAEMKQIMDQKCININLYDLVSRVQFFAPKLFIIKIADFIFIFKITPILFIKSVLNKFIK